MSDTITPEERVKLLAHVNSGYMTISGEGLKKALDALESAEARAEKAEAQVERLTKERDWLAKSLAEDGCPYLAFWSDFGSDMRPDWCICTDTADDGFDCTGDPKECWLKEAARKAVDGEGKA